MKVRHILIGVTSVLLLWMAIGVWLPGLMDSAGEFGDQFGSVNALFSGLAFAGVIYAVILQSKELELQREELKQTREVLEEQKQQLEEQNKTMQQQRFENTFFQMLSLHSEIVRKIRYASLEGKETFGRFKESLFSSINMSQQDLPLRLKVFFENAGYIFGNYFENLHIILRMVDNSPVEDKCFYTNVVHAQLSTHELAVIYYFCLSEGREDFKSLVEHYAFFEGLPNEAIGFLDNKSFYSPLAFGSQASEDSSV